VLQHAPARVYFEDQEALGNRIPPLTDEVELIARYGARVVGVALNHEHLASDERTATVRRISRETGLPAVFPLLDGVEALLPPLLALASGRTSSAAVP